jgi:Flp pilus assembly protein TadD
MTDELKRYEKALTAYEQAIRLDPNSARAYHEKGVVLEALGMEKEAQKAHQRARELGYRD